MLGSFFPTNFYKLFSIIAKAEFQSMILKILDLLHDNYVWVHFSEQNGSFQLSKYGNNNPIGEAYCKLVSIYSKSYCSCCVSIDSCFSSIVCKIIRITHQHYPDVTLPPLIGKEKPTGHFLLHVVNYHSSLLFIQLIQIFIVAWQDKFRQKINIAIQQ